MGIEKEYAEIIDDIVGELTGTIIGTYDISEDGAEWFIYSNLKESMDKVLKMGYLRGVDDSKEAVGHLRQKQEA